MLDIKKLEIGNILANRKFEVKESKRPINYNWEEAKLFCEYCGIGKDSKSVIMVLKLFKQYGKPKVLAVQSWLKDNNFDKEKVIGLIIWRLKNAKNNKDSKGVCPNNVSV